MAYDLNVGQDFTFPASGDLSANQFKFVTLNSSGQTQLAGANVECVGVQQDAPAAAGRASQVRIFGISKVKLGGSVAAMDKVASNASGLGVKSTSASVSAGTPEPIAGSLVQGIALAAGVTGDIIPVLLTHSGLSN